MDPRTTASGRSAERRRPRRPPAARRPGLLLGAAAAGALLVNVVVGADPAAQAGPGSTGSVGVAQELGLTAGSGAVDVARDLQPEDLQPLEDLAASRGSREAEEATAQQAQAAADQAALDRQHAEAEAAAAAQRAAEEAAAAEAAARAAAAEAAADQAAADEAAAREAAAAEEAPAPSSGAPSAAAPAGSGTAATATARIGNTAGPVQAVVQAAANAVVSNVAGAGSITLGGTRASAADPNGHPSGLALDYMTMSNTALGNAIVQYHVAHWDELGVDYLIYQQKMLSSPGGTWSAMADRGSATANHVDHVHVNYEG